MTIFKNVIWWWWFISWNQAKTHKCCLKHIWYVWEFVNKIFLAKTPYFMSRVLLLGKIWHYLILILLKMIVLKNYFVNDNENCTLNCRYFHTFHFRATWKMNISAWFRLMPPVKIEYLSVFWEFEHSLIVVQ